MSVTSETTAEPWGALVRREWKRFRSRGRVTAMIAAVSAVVLLGLPLALVVVIAVAARFASAGRREGSPAEAAAPGGRILAAKAFVTGMAAFSCGLVAAWVVVPAGPAILRAKGVGVLTVSAFTGTRVVVGIAVLFAVAAVFALVLGALARRAWAAVLGGVSLVVLPYLLGVLSLLPDEVSRWALRVTPAAAFSVQQTLREYPQVTAYYAPSSGYLPLPWWAGLAVLCGYAAAAFGLAVLRLRAGGGSGRRHGREGT